jgi:hypothetical protein
MTSGDIMTSPSWNERGYGKERGIGHFWEL